MRRWGMLVLGCAMQASVWASLGVVAAWDSLSNKPEYLAGALELDQALAGPSERFGTIFNVVTVKGTTAKQATRQSTDGTFGNATGLLTFEGEPVAASVMESAALRINNGERVDFVFTNVSAGAVRLGMFYFDYGRSNNTAPTTITLIYRAPDGAETVLLTDSSTPNTGSVGDYADFGVDLGGITVEEGGTISLALAASNGSTGGNIDNVALTIREGAPREVCRYPAMGTWLDTADWIGWIDSATAPWYYAAGLAGWLYIPTLPDPCGEEGVWLFIPRP